MVGRMKTLASSSIKSLLQKSACKATIEAQETNLNKSIFHKSKDAKLPTVQVNCVLSSQKRRSR